MSSKTLNPTLTSSYNKYDAIKYVISLLLLKYSKKNTETTNVIKRYPTQITSCIIVQFLGDYYKETKFNNNDRLLLDLSKLFNSEIFELIEEIDITPILFEIYNQTDNLSGIRKRYHYLFVYFYENCPNLIKYHKGKKIEDVIINTYNMKGMHLKGLLLYDIKGRIYFHNVVKGINFDYVKLILIGTSL